MRRIAHALVATMVVGGAAAGVFAQTTETRYAGNVVPNTAWTDETESEGNPGCSACDCNSTSAPYTFNSVLTDTTWLVCDAVQNFTTIPANWDIASVSVDVMCRYDTNDAGRVDWDFQVPGVRGWTSTSFTRSGSFTSGSGNCGYRLGASGEITLDLGRSWTVADLNNLQLRVRRVTDGANTTLRVRAFRVVVEAVPPDPNESCPGSPIGMGSTPVVFTGAERVDGFASCEAEPTIDRWYQFVAPQTGRYAFGTCGGVLDTVVSVIAGCGGPEIACDDDGCSDAGFQSRAVADLVGGAAYNIRLGSYEPGSTALVITMAPPAPGNDTCGGAFAAGIGNTSINFDSAVSVNGLASCEFDSTLDLWYRFTPSTTGSYRFSTCGALLDTVLSVYSSCGGTELGCDDDGCGAASDLTVNNLIAGTAYLVRVGSYELGSTVLNIAGSTPPPSNDTCGGAVAVGAGNTSINFGSNVSVNGASSCEFDVTRDLWYRFTPSTTGSYRFSTCGASLDTVLSVYSSCGGTELGCDDDGCGVASDLTVNNLIAGTAYLVRVGSYELGSTVLNIAGSTPPPANDTCGGAVSVGVGNTSINVGSNVSANGASSCEFDVTRDLWYRFTPGTSGSYRFSTCGASLDTVLSVYSSCGGTELGCDDDGCGVASDVTLGNLIAGTAYLIRVGSYELGSTVLNIAGSTPPPSNDTCGGAVAVGAGNTSINFGANVSVNGASSCEFDVTRDLWYRFTPSTTGSYRFSTCGASLDTVLSVYSSCGGTELGCDDDGCGVASDLTVNNLIAGTAYLVRVGSYELGSTVLNIAGSTPPPANDTCGGAVAVGAGNTSINFGANVSVNGESSCESFETLDLWYRFTPGTTGSYRLSTCGASLDTVLSVYSSCGGTELGCDDDGCDPDSFTSDLTVNNLIAGTAYLIRVGSYELGSTVLNIESAIVCPSDYNGDGGVDADDVIAFFADWDAGALAADFNGDGGVDSDDVIGFFGRWDSGC